MAEPYIYVCDDCGSTDVSDNRISAYWNPDTQKWDYDHYDSGMYCYLCGDDGSVTERQYDKDRYAKGEYDFEVGDVVRFHPLIVIYDHLTGNKYLPENPELALAIVIDPDSGDENASRAKSYDDTRGTVMVRLMTGEAVEVWPRDLVKVEK